MRTTGKIRLGRVISGLAWVFVFGCSADKSEVKAVAGIEGESCQVHDDCGSGLSCIHQVCVTGAGTAQKDAGAPTTTSLGARGESCTSRADCATGLACLSNVCADPTAPRPDAGALVVGGQRGESCRTRADCASGLACVTGTCALADFDITPTTKTCKLVECTTAADCCPKPDQSCPFYKDFCDNGDQTYCTEYQTLCVCDEKQRACTDNKCVFTPKCDPTATPPISCVSPLVCSGTRCVQCKDDTDCAAGTCVNEKCLTKCEKDSDCPYFNKCTGGACQKSGCTTDRECIASTGNVRSKCSASECLVPCETDLECDSPVQFKFKACLSGFCKDVGCETDEECRIALKAPPGGTLDAVCQ